MKQPLHVTQRPLILDEVLGQDHVKAAYAKLLRARKQHLYIFSGPSGVGKTTLARIGAREVGALERTLVELDGAQVGGVDQMRDLVASCAYKPMGGGRRAVIIDEAHRVTAQAWDVLLKTFEEAPSHLYVFLCTTDPTKIPKTIMTRATHFALQPIPTREIVHALLELKEKGHLEAPEDFLRIIADECNGSMRHALVWAVQAGGVKTEADLYKVVGTAVNDDAVLRLCRLMAKPQGDVWRQLCTLIQDAVKSNVDAESARYVINAYFQKVALNSDSERKALEPLRVLSIFDIPFPPNSKAGMLLLPAARALRIGE